MAFFPTDPRDFYVGQRVELHPATDCWMAGARFGTVTKIGTKYVTVRLDRLATPRRFAPSNVTAV